MDRNREARRVTMAASNGLSRRRHRSNSLRDSPEDDGPLELQETARLRDRGPVKKDRDRDRERDHRDREKDRDRDRDRISSRSKRRRGDRMMHGSNRDDGGDDSSEESVNDEEDEDDDDGSGVGGGPGGSSMRMLPPNPTSFSSSSMSNHHHRKSFPPPAKVFRTGPTMTSATPPAAATPSPNATPWKAPDEMIGVSVPRKARSASTKRSHECWASSGSGVVGGEQIHRQASTSPARSSGPSPAPIFASASPSPAPVSPPSSSNASVKKKMKPNGPKQRPPKSFTKSVPSTQDEIEIEIAQVLFGLGRQPQGTSKQEVMGNDSIKFDSRDVNNNINKPSFDSKSRVSSPISNSPSTATLAPSSIPPTTNSSSSANHMSAIAPRRKRPRPVKYEEENSSAYPVRSSPMSFNSKAEIDQPAKIDASSPNLEKNTVENGGISYDLSAKSQPEAVKPENNNLSESKPMAEESTGRDLTVNREEPRSPKKEAPSGLRMDGDRGCLAGARGNSAIPESETHREKFQIDLMAPPPSRSSPERDSEIGFVATDPKKPKLQDVEMEVKPMVKDDDRKAVKIGKDDMKAEHVEKRTKLIAEESEFQKPSVNRDGNTDLHFDLEKSDRENTNALGTANRLQFHGQMVQQQQTNAEKNVQTSSLPLPMPLPSWPGALPHMGYMAPLQGVVSMEGNAVPSTPIQPPHLLFNQPRPKRCASHCYIARIIQCHQQISRMNPFWPAATGSALAYGPKPCNVNVVPSSELHASRGVNSVQEKGQGIAIFPGPAGKDKNSQPSNTVDNNQRRPIVLQQAIPPGAPGNILHGPAFIFPLSQQQAAAAAAVRPGTVKSPPVAGSGGSSSSGSVSASTTGVAGATALSFNYPNMPGNETQYLAILQNGPYPIPIPAHVGGTPPYRGAHPQALPFFNGSFYSSQMIHPSQLQQHQSAAPPSQQSQQGHQNPSISSGSSSSQKHLQNQQQRPHGSGINGGSGNLQGFPAPKHQQSHSLQLQQRQQTQSQNVPHQARQLESEVGSEDSPSTADSRASRSSMSIYGQNFAIPMNQTNFALMTPSSMGAPTSNPGDKKQHSHTHGSKPGVEALTSQPFAMSFPSINGTSAPGFDISSIAQNHAFIQNLPEATRHSYHFMAAAASAQAAQQKKNYRVSDEGKTVATDGSNLEEERKAMAGGKAPTNAAQLIAFSRPDLVTDASAPPMPGNTVIDTSARTLNLSSTPARASSSVMSASISNANTPPVQQQLQRNHQQQLLQHQLQQHQHQQMQQQQQQMQQQHQQLQQQQQQQRQQLQQQQQVIQLQKQHQFAAAAAASARSKAPATSNGSVYSDHLSSPSVTTKFPNTLPAFPQTLVQSSSSPVQSPQWKNSMRTTTSQIQPPSLSSASPPLKNLPQHQGRTQQAHAQISFSANPKPTAVQQGQGPPSNNQSSSPPMAVGSPTTSSVSKGAGGSPRTSSSTGNKGGQSSSLSSQQAKNSPSMPAQKSSPAGGRNVPSILGHPHNAPSPSSSGTKPQLTQQQQQQLPKHALQQAQMLYTTAYMAQHAAGATNSGSAASGFYLQRHRGEHQQQPPGPSGNSSSGMLSLGTPVTLSNTSTTDSAKAAAAASNVKGGSLTSQSLVHAQFAAAETAGKQQHQLLPAGFSYVHAVPSTVQVKPSEQKQPAGE